MPASFPRVPAALVAVLLMAAPAAADPGRDLAQLCDEYWEGQLKANPSWATSLGDRRYDHLLEDLSPAGLAADRRRLAAVLTRAQGMPAAALSPADRLTRSALIESLEGQLARLDCALYEWVVDPLRGPHVGFMNYPDITVIHTPTDAANYVLRCRAMGRYMDQHIAHLATGLAAGKIATRVAVDKSLRQIDDLLALPVAEWAILSPLAAERADWPAAERERFRLDLTTAVDTVVRPAIVRYRDFLRDRIVPAARPEAEAGLAALPGGEACYRRLIRVHTSLDLAPADLHRLGLEQVARFRSELAALGERALGTGEIAEIQRRLREDPAMHFAAADEIEAKAREALARAKDAIARWFGITPRADCEVRVMGMHEAPNSTVAYYRQPAVDGSRPGVYMLNTYLPETRPRYEAEALAFHEAIPGHHLQIAIAQELTGLPAFRRHQGVTAFVEGWALYAERLADEMGLYSGDLDRIGMLSYDAWRSCRLVVDTGLHALGWSRQQAIDYMLENSVLAPNNIVNEVDRYVAWPGQALAYKVGQLEILRLRDEARRRLGDRFDIRGFHDAVLADGAVALAVLRERLEDWCARVEARR